LLQLETAASLGWQAPPTLVSQDPARIREFCLKAPNGEIVVKALGATRGRTTASVAARWEDLEQADLGLCPTVYEHRIPGDRHLRINCFGERVEAFRIETPIMDWRRDHTAAISHVDLDSETSARARALVERLGLAMGVIDAKLLDDGSSCFLEVNPQGQFLFLQAATGVDLVDACAEFLVGRT
jgi:glutathione synthase/RimK-type ligase-like ATP-grasp enzyme